VDELKKKCKVQQDQIFQLKQDLTNTTAELKLRAVQAEGKWKIKSSSCGHPWSIISISESVVQGREREGSWCGVNGTYMAGVPSL